MKRLGVLSLVASAAFFACGFAVAQDDYLPLVQEETVSIVRIDASKIDGQQLSKQFQSVATSVVDALVKDQEQAEQAKEALPLLGVMVAQNVATYVKPLQEAGVTNVYFVVEQPKSEDEILYPYFAIPTKDLSKEQVTQIREALKQLNKALNSTIKYRFERNGFMIVLIIPETVDSDEAKAYAKNRFLKFNTVEKPQFAEGFKVADPNAIIANVTINSRNEEMIQKQIENATTILDSVDSDPDLAQAVKDSINKFNELGKQANEYVSFEVLTVNLDAPDVVIQLQAKSADDAQKYVDLMQGDVKAEFSKMFAAILESKSVSEAKFDGDVKEIESLLDELFDVFVQSEVDGAMITWKFDKTFCEKSKPTFDKVLAFVTAQIEKIQAEIEATQEDASEDGDEEIEIEE